jgi:hypothetical protein
MKVLSHKLLVAALTAGSFVGLPLLGGCESHYHEHVAAAPYGDTVVYKPGYYYDAEY